MTRRLAREVRNTFAEEDSRTQIAMIEWQEISEPPPADLVMDARALPQAATAIDATVHAAEAAAAFADWTNDIAARTAPAEATIRSIRVVCALRSTGVGASFLDLDGDFLEEEDDEGGDTASLDAVIADAKAFQGGDVASDPSQHTARLLATPLWSLDGSPPLWAGGKWADLKDELPEDEDWWVWTDWYEAHMRGAAQLNKSVELMRVNAGETGQRHSTSDINAAIATVVKATADPLTLAVEHALKSTAAVSTSFDFDAHWDRIQDLLPSDPAAAIGATKDMLESVQKTILDRRGHQNVDALKFPQLVHKCLSELGLKFDAAPATPAERHARKFASNAASMIEAIAKLRNDAGTGHGHSTHPSSTTENPPAGTEPSVPDARLAAATGFVLAAWLLHHEGQQLPSKSAP